ncbi:MAG: hypothetical protein GVY33_08595 [Alphaproteobacteria bacterium]|nr:hypothetical protein [Alphaproteobacteria bacterium]
MGERLRIPFVVDVLRVRTPEEVLALADAAVLDRRFAPHLPLVNRLIQARMDWTMGSGSSALPSALPRDHPGRGAAQAELTARLEPAKRPWDDASLDALAEAIRGRPKRTLGELVQEAVGRLFEPQYRATPATWRAALALDAGLRSNNPLTRFTQKLTRTVPHARRTLAWAVGGDLAGVHATGIAVHTMLGAVERLADALRDRELAARLSTRAVLGRALTAPDIVVRTATMPAETPAGPVAAGTLVMLETAAATELSADPRVAFLSESWSACPAHATVPAMLAEIWWRATGERVELAPTAARAEP